jgi:hypothetical protein
VRSGLFPLTSWSAADRCCISKRVQRGLLQVRFSVRRGVHVCVELLSDFFFFDLLLLLLSRAGS